MALFLLLALLSSSLISVYPTPSFITPSSTPLSFIHLSFTPASSAQLQSLQESSFCKHRLIL